MPRFPLKKRVFLCFPALSRVIPHFSNILSLYNNSFEFNMMEHDKFLMQELYSRPCSMFNVGAMMPWMDYTPRTLEQVELLSNGWKIESVGKNE